MNDGFDTLRDMVKTNINDTLGAIEKSRESVLKLVDLDLSDADAERLAQLMKLTSILKETANKRAGDDQLVGHLLPIMAGPPKDGE